MTANLSINKKSSTFLRYIHNFRGLAILIIVMSHVYVYLDWQDSQLAKAIGLVLLKDGTVYFVFIAGLLFQYLSYKYTFKKYIEKKLKYVILPYLVVSLPAVAYSIYSQKIYSDVWFYNAFPDWSIVKQFVVLYLTGAHLYPLWFVPMIAIFYLCSPLLILIDKNSKCYWVILFALPFLFAFPRPQIQQIFQSFIYFFPVYLLGMFCSHYIKRVLFVTQKFLPILTIISVILSFLYGYQVLFADLFISKHLYVNTFNREIQCFLLVYLLYKLDDKLSSRTHEALCFIANISFGIYFFHGYILSIYFKIIERLPASGLELDNGNFITFVITSLVVTLASMALVILCQKYLGKNSRYLIGC